MEKIMVVVFDDETKAHRGIRALRNLEAEGSVEVHGGALIRKDESGTTIIPNSDLEELPMRTLEGTMLGGAIGLLGGPAGVAAGAGLGAIAGWAGDMAMATVDEDLVYEVAKQLQPGKCAAVLDVTEDWVTPVDADLEPYSKAIFRRPKVDVEEELTAKRIEAEQKEMDALEREWEQAREDQKAKIHARMEELRSRTRRQIDYLNQRREQIRRENEVKVNALQKKISTSNAEREERVKARIDDLNRGDQEFLDRINRSIAALKKADMEFTNRVESSIARGLHKAAKHFEDKKMA